MYYVYAGSYKVDTNALNQGIELFKAGYDVICTKLNRYFRLQVGAFTSYENAENFKAELQSKGFPCFIEEVDERIPVAWQLIYLTQN